MDNTLSGKNILVTGGAGLVGGHLTEKLIALGANVFVLDIVVKPGSYFETQKLKDKATLLIQDVRDTEALRAVVGKNQITEIYHLAAQALVPLAYNEPKETLDINIMGTVSVLEAARLNSSVKAVVVASSDKAYGKDCLNAAEDQKLAGDHPYDVSKSAADLICTAYFKTYGTPVAISRFGNIFGPGDLSFDRIVPGAMQAIIKKQQLDIRSDGKFIRDYVYVNDVVDGYLVLAEKIGISAGQAFNFSSGFNSDVLGLLKKIQETIGQKLEYQILNNQKNEIPSQSLNYEKATRLLGWSPQADLDQAFLATFEWYKNHFRES